MEGVDMITARAVGICILAFSVSRFMVRIDAARNSSQAAQLPDTQHPEQHQHGHQMNTPSGVSDTCEPTFTYSDGPYGPSQWGGVCNSGRMQTPIDITRTQKLSVPPLQSLDVSYQPANLDVVNDCNKYQLKIRFPENLWLKVGRKPYRLSEVDFHEPAENAVDGKRAPMSIQLVHLSPESTFLVIEVPVVVGKENPVIKAVWSHIPAPGREQATTVVKINAADLLPADHGFYRFPGSLTAPICNEGVTWFLMKHPIEMSAAQIAAYRALYHNTARPLQPLNDRPVFESQ
jgi:carbonic anhydrase